MGLFFLPATLQNRVEAEKEVRIHHGVESALRAGHHSQPRSVFMGEKHCVSLGRVQVGAGIRELVDR